MLRFAFLTILLFFFKLSYSQTLPLETYTPANGLIDARISKMFQDSQGLLYFLSPEGFSVYDGQHFDNYGTGLKYGTGIISDITEYKSGRVKVYSYDGDILWIDHDNLKTDTSKRSLFREVSEILNLGQDDKIFITNYHILRETGNQIKILNPGIIKPGFILFSSIIGRYLVLVESGEDLSERLYLYDYIHQKTDYCLPLKKNTLFMGLVSNQVLLASSDGTWKSFDPQKVIKDSKIQLEPYKNPAFQSVDFRESKIQFNAKDKTLWLVKPQKGYWEINLLNQSKEYYSVSDGISSTANWVFEDAENNFWFGSTARGVQKLQSSPLEIKTQVSGINLSYIHSINKTESGKSFIDAKEGVFMDEKRVVPSSKTRKEFIFWDHEYWHFSDYKTLKGSRGSEFHLDKLIPEYKSQDFLFSHCDIDRQGRLRIAGRVFIFIDKSHHFKFFRPGYFCDNIIELRNDEFGCFLRSDRFLKLKWGTNSIHKVFEQNIPHLAPRFSIQWDSNTYFVATRLNGLRIFRWDQGKLKEMGFLNKSKGLSNNFIYVLLKKDPRHLILGTAAGLDQVIFQIKDTLIENLTQRMNVFTPFTDLIQTGNGEILCRTIDGQLFNLKKNYRSPSNYLPKAVFKSIMVNNQKIDYDLKNEFNFEMNHFLFTARTPTYFDNKNIRYSFLLNNEREVWKQNTNNSDFEIKNLPPGYYTLKLNIQYPGRIYPNAEMKYQFRIRSPYWQTGWFILSLILVFMVSVIYSVKGFYNRRFEKQIHLLEKQTAVEEERTRIATDMHDDFGANLSRIKFISEKIQILHRSDPYLNNDLIKISSYTDEMSEKMNEIVWALNQRNDSLGDLLSFCRSFAADYLQDKNIKLVFNADPITDQKIQGEVRRNIFMVIKEAIHNIAKHSKADRVYIEFKNEKDLQIRIQDNGVGICLDSIRPFGNGLENMKKRVKDIGGQIQIDNDHGTLIQMVIPIG